MVTKLLACPQIARSPSAPRVAPTIQGDTSGNSTTATPRREDRPRPRARARQRPPADTVPRQQRRPPANQPCPDSPGQAQEHREAKVGNNRFRVQHHAARLPARCQSVDASVSILDGLALDRRDWLDAHRSAVNAQTGLRAVGEDALGDLLVPQT